MHGQESQYTNKAETRNSENQMPLQNSFSKSPKSTPILVRKKELEVLVRSTCTPIRILSSQYMHYLNRNPISFSNLSATTAKDILAAPFCNDFSGKSTNATLNAASPAVP